DLVLYNPWLLNLNPGAVLAPIGKRGAQQPNPGGHSSGFRIEVKLPLRISQTELIASCSRIGRCRINWRTGGGLIRILDHLQAMNPGQHRRAAARGGEFDRDRAVLLKG